MMSASFSASFAAACLVNNPFFFLSFFLSLGAPPQFSSSSFSFSSFSLLQLTDHSLFSDPRRRAVQQSQSSQRRATVEQAEPEPEHREGREGKGRKGRTAAQEKRRISYSSTSTSDHDDGCETETGETE
jgi:hypothetical protein